jgi:UPF0716 protein FxsA
MGLLLLALIGVPLIEIYFLVLVGARYGAMHTVMMVLFTALLGGFLLRLEGLRTLAKIRANVERRQLPALELVEGAMLLVAGVLLLTPGFLTDIIGFLVLVPRLRSALAGRAIRTVFARTSDAGHVIDVDFERRP